MPIGDASTTITPPAHKSSSQRRLWLGGLLQSRVCLVPTLRGWMALLLLIFLLTYFGGRNLCRFLSPRDSVPGGVLVVEGWVPPYAAREALAEYRSHPYLAIYVTGEPIEEGNPYISYGSYADFTAAKLREMGAPADKVHAVPAPLAGKDRTFTMASELKKRLAEDGISAAKINVLSVGPHSRRSRLLFEHAFGSESQIGILAVAPREFDPDHWWTTSNGVRGVLSEAIGYLYARFLFQPTTG